MFIKPQYAVQYVGETFNFTANLPIMAINQTVDKELFNINIRLALDGEITQEEFIINGMINRIDEAIQDNMELRIQGATAKGRRDLAMTGSTFLLDKLEKKTYEYLLQLAKNFITSDVPIHVIKYRYNDIIKKDITESVAHAYLVGVSTVHTISGIKPQISSVDEMKITNISDQSLNYFWKIVQNGRIAHQTKISGADAFDFIRSLMSYLFTTAVNLGTWMGGSQVQATINDQGNLDYEASFEVVTMHDDSVCEYCMPVDGMIVTPKDIDFSIPPFHINCRCRLLLRVPNATYTDVGRDYSQDFIQ